MKTTLTLIETGREITPQDVVSFATANGHKWQIMDFNMCLCGVLAKMAGEPLLWLESNLQDTDDWLDDIGKHYGIYNNEMFLISLGFITNTSFDDPDPHFRFGQAVRKLTHSLGLTP